MLESGVHATIAGVVMGLLTPALPLLTPEGTEALVDELRGPPRPLGGGRPPGVHPHLRGIPPTERLEYLLHPWTSYLIVPVFALVNAGIPLTRDGLTNPSSITVGVILGLVVGKTVGISLFSWVTVRLGVARLPEGVRFSQLVGVAVLAGIGFTVSLFVSSLAFPTGSALRDAKVGILVASGGGCDRLGGVGGHRPPIHRPLHRGNRVA